MARIGWDHLDALVAGQASAPDHVLEEFARTGKPVLTVYRKPEFECPAVLPDNNGGIDLAVGHLVEHGHRDIAFVGRDPADADDPIRFAAYQAAMRRRGLTPHRMVTVNWALDESYDATATVLQLRQGGQLPAAAVVVTDLVAMSLIRSLAQAGVKVPGDMAVIGFDDVADAAAFQPPLSTISQSFLLAGATVCDLALDAVQGIAVEPGVHCTPVAFVRRESCGCVPGNGPVAAPDGSNDEPIRARLVDGLAEAAHDVRELTRSQREVLAGVADRLADLFTVMAGTPESDHTADLRAATADLRPLVVKSPNPLQIVNAVRAFARALAARLAPDDFVVAATFERLVFDLAVLLLEDRDLDVRGRPTVYHDREIQRRYFMIGTDLVRQPTLAGRSLAWLADTEFQTGCLALWDGRPGADHLRITSTYDRDDRLPELTDACAVSCFPPSPLVELADDQVDDFRYVYVLPVRFGGSDWGFLALSGSLDPREEAAFERYNHWAVLMAVALTNEQAIHSERTLLAEIRTSEERYALAAEAANDGLWDWDLESGTVFYSARWKALLGCADDEIAATPGEWLDRIHPDDRARVDAMLAEHLAGRTLTTELEHRLRAVDGTYRWMLTRWRSMCDATGVAIRLVGSITDITDRKLIEERLRRAALYDDLTGLPNRAYFRDRLTTAIARSSRRIGYRYAVLMLDLDGFKIVNDSLGHLAGDHLLQQVAGRLTASLRSTDTVARFGGDEFAVLLEELVDDDSPVITAARLQKALSVPHRLGDTEAVVSVSIGITVGRADYTDTETIMRDADAAMYHAKTHGKRSHAIFDPAMHGAAVNRLRIENELRRAIENHNLVLHYQPIVDLRTGLISGAEALIRWQHPTRGLLPPSEFLTVAEESGLILSIGTWVLDESCRQMHAWDLHRGDARPFMMSVNVANRQFWQSDLIDDVDSRLRSFGLSPDRLAVEITEGVIMDDVKLASSLLRGLKTIGVQVHIDDFGTGYSSLEALHDLSIDAFKIDRSFISRMSTSPRSKELVRTIVTMGVNLELDVIAEGIETDEELDFVRALGCSHGQGYLFSRPVEAEAFRKLLEYDSPEPDFRPAESLGER